MDNASSYSPHVDDDQGFFGPGPRDSFGHSDTILHFFALHLERFRLRLRLSSAGRRNMFRHGGRLFVDTRDRRLDSLWKEHTTMSEGTERDEEGKRGIKYFSGFLVGRPIYPLTTLVTYIPFPI